jgi:opacity protein-like surface antigen
MKRMLAAAAVFALCSGAAFADDKPTDDEAAKIKEAVAAWGCEGGSYEKETEGTGVYEAEDVKCKQGQYDFRLEKDFKVFSITKD